MHRLFPDSLVMLRLLPALAHAATVALAGETARRLGGGRWAEAVAALSVLTGVVYLAQGTILITDLVQPLTWLFCCYALIRIIRDGEERWWLAIGAVAGVALLTKYMIAFWLAALGLGLVLTPARRSLARPWLYLGAGLALLIVLPNILWQAATTGPSWRSAGAPPRPRTSRCRRWRSSTPRSASSISPPRRCGSRGSAPSPSGGASGICGFSPSPSWP